MTATRTTEVTRYINLHCIEQAAKPVKETMRFGGVVVPWMSMSHRLNDLGGERECFERGAAEPLMIEGELAVPLTPQHDHSVFPIGKALTAEDRDEGLYMEFRLANTDAGREAAELIDDEMVRGLSIEAMVGMSSRRERMDDEPINVVDRAQVQGVGLVGTAAYPAARVTNMRALHVVEFTSPSSPPSSNPTPVRDAAAAWLTKWSDENGRHAQRRSAEH